MIKIIDFLLALCLIIILFIPSLLLAITIKLNSKGPIFHISKRVGLNKKIFKMYKFRTMYIDTPDLATHLLKEPNKYITKFGKFLRKSSLDEIPQLYNIINGDMSFVGPRPALFNQYDLINLRERLSVFTIKPGITGLAQINGRDNLSIDQKVIFDKEFLQNYSLSQYFKILFLTLLYIFKTQSIKH